MLTFYLLPDEAPRPSRMRLDELPKAGELSAEDFAELQAQRIIEGRLDYDQDFRWSNGVAQMKLQLLLHRHPQLRPNDVSTPEQRLFVLLLNASAADQGLLAIAD
ncbi:hypothetical protein [Hymenobacter jeollabukensis]|uniref:Uncharacterized protein n=1 Tax=Hymenobacter jeollabukensis TaxID=2025313 RepID=A0A5R8WVI7_9BACT|nr:hypothetical protein [Hymenobacter jeollabukensis]TLM95503.1 hypothetical protein FDY95_06870 [Hymenobacter jeollabukensis]